MSSSSLSEARFANQNPIPPKNDKIATVVYSQISNGSDDRPTNACEIADETALVKRKREVTIERIFLGALVNAYSRPVIEAKISLKAIRT